MNKHENEEKNLKKRAGHPNNGVPKKKNKGTVNNKRYKVNIRHKDTLFRHIFTSNKEWTLALYNAVNGSNYTNPDDIVVTTIDDAVYMKMKNDISFLITDILNFYEHQSTYNPNMPVRMLIYAGMVYSSYTDDESNDYNIYSSKLGSLPTPRCICFYNGEKKQPEKTILRLSDSFKGNSSEDADIEVTVTMLNINYGHNQRILNACRPLMEYSWFVEEIRKNRNRQISLENAIDKALDEMPEEYVIRSWLMKNRAEVKRMCITEYDEKKVKRSFEREAQRERERADKAELLADEERTRANEEKIRADKAEAELAALKAQFGIS